MVKSILQKLANLIISMIDKVQNEKDLLLIFSMGLHLDNFAIKYFKIYLD